MARLHLFALSQEFTVCTREHPDFTGPLRRDGSGHREMIVDFTMPGRLKTGGVPPKPPATILLSLCPSVFWDFGSLFRTLRRYFLRAVAAAVFSSRSLRRPRLRVAAQASRTSHSRCSCSFRRCGVLYHVMSRQACLLSSVPQDVAASQCVCSRGADNLTLRRPLASRCHWFLQVVAATADAWWIIVQYVNKFPS